MPREGHTLGYRQDTFKDPGIESYYMAAILEPLLLGPHDPETHIALVREGLNIS
jgi:hypothetical protein